MIDELLKDKRHEYKVSLFDAGHIKELLNNKEDVRAQLKRRFILQPNSGQQDKNEGELKSNEQVNELIEVPISARNQIVEHKPQQREIDSDEAELSEETLADVNKEIEV